MRTKIKRICASLLTASMLVTSLSSTAFADDNTTTEGWTADHSAYFYQVNDEWQKAVAERVEKEPTCTEAGTITYSVNVEGVAPYVETGKPAKGHTAGGAVKENETAPTCTTDGSYDEVTYCADCNAELSRNTKTVAATGHTAGDPKEEIVQNDYDLSINKYKQTEYKPVEYPPTSEIMAELRRLEDEIRTAMDELEKML